MRKRYIAILAVCGVIAAAITYRANVEWCIGTGEERTSIHVFGLPVYRSDPQPTGLRGWIEPGREAPIWVTVYRGRFRPFTMVDPIYFRLDKELAVVKSRLQILGGWDAVHGEMGRDLQAMLVEPGGIGKAYAAVREFDGQIAALIMDDSGEAGVEVWRAIR